MDQDQIENLTSKVLVRSILDQRIDSSELLSLLTHPEINWMDLFRFSGDHLITPSIYSILEKSLIGEALHPDVREGLALVHAANVSRNLHILKTLRNLTLLLNRSGILPIPLKGVALLLNGTYPDPGDRVTGDIDLLIPPEQIPVALEILAENGYVQQSNHFSPAYFGAGPEIAPIDCADFRNNPYRKGYHHLPPVKSSPGDPVWFELHTLVTSVNKGSGGRLNKLVWSHAQSFEVDGVIYGMLTTEFNLLHTLHHALVHHRALTLGRTDYRHLLDADYLLKEIIANGRVTALQNLVEAVGIQNEFTFFLWQSQDVLGTDHMPQWNYSSEGLALVDDFQRVSSSRSASSIRRFQDITKRRLKHYLCTPFLRNAYGEQPVYKTLPLFSRYLLGKLMRRAS